MAPPFLTLVVDGAEGSAPRPDRFTSAETALRAHWTRGWVGTRANLDAMEKKNISRPSRKSNPGCPVRNSSLYRVSYPGSSFTDNTNAMFLYNLTYEIQIKLPVISIVHHDAPFPVH
jgi:hypothetical protein